MAQATRQKFAAEGQPFTVFIEGNIGSGKTTYLNYFNKYDEVSLQTEPVEKWRNVGGVNILVISSYLIFNFLNYFCLIKLFCRTLCIKNRKNGQCHFKHMLH